MHRALGPNHVAATTWFSSDAREHAARFLLDEPIEHELAATLTRGQGALIRCDGRALVRTLCDWCFRLGLPAR
ncbi:MAG: hypothetical protein FWD73_04165 [Polyangiaceae bacterium]|nr:hypothetical protein [Polyangiaceae bacterium]